MRIKVLNPTGVAQQREVSVSARIPELKGKVIGILDNGKPNFDIFARRLDELLRGRFETKEVRHLSKGHLGAASPLSRERLDAFADGCDAVISGIGD